MIYLLFFIVDQLVIHSALLLSLLSPALNRYQLLNVIGMEGKSSNGDGEELS